MSEQRVAIVTGGGSGIGLAISQRLASDGHSVAVLDVNGESAAAAAKAIDAAGGKAVGLPADVSVRDQVFAAADEVRERLGRPGILVNNAGMGATFNRFLKITTEVWNQTLGVNLTGAFHCCQAVLPDMVEAGWGRIVNISSSSTHSGQALLSPYVSSKSGLNGLTKSLALEFGPRGITVNAVPPGSSTPRCSERPKPEANSEKGASTTPWRALRCGGWGFQRMWPPPAPSSAATRRATSPGRSSG
jgi:NAD(P)-dependent dehydrogenase (short-subunit alcohol dehydrogenase family)